ncbi:1-deoxy-D-xylulose-5-phosphate synthase [Anaeromusa sp.]|uniref:1-deoxy-D-xylulose-5-phosphate synthase n=1 Tax=Anaeromusa sp. TaxID=1872520 RepID=UPI002607C1DD|nr:1-deoxy-D-xylulose-5-phosphate synthase [Anaeromusa sp.]MDD3158161.1 1-deoxy-D-xylulose-5-phosphate synthase [Anaeromusa sp.]
MQKQEWPDYRTLKSYTEQQLQELSGCVREFLLQNISQTGGHIGANLGTVELTIALHAVFSLDRDKLLWDTGHQGYTHKLLTGRAKQFATLNAYGGMSRFVCPAESEYDILDATHAGTAISAAYGLAQAKALRDEEGYTVAIVGDGAMAEGLTWEGLNHAAAQPVPGLIVVLNDNGYAISPGFGALHNCLQSGHMREWCEALGMDYIGPVDGHDVAAVKAALERARARLTHPNLLLRRGVAAGDGVGEPGGTTPLKRPNTPRFLAEPPLSRGDFSGGCYPIPSFGGVSRSDGVESPLERGAAKQRGVLIPSRGGVPPQGGGVGKLPFIHLRTQKGRGWTPADSHPYRMHFSFAFDPQTGQAKTSGVPSKTYPDWTAAALEKAMESDESIVAITPSTRYATGLDRIFSRFPARSFDPGMEEQHALTFAAGLALGGAKPVVCYQSTFMQRAYDQLYHDICYPNLPVLLLLARSGFAGYDGPTHHGIYDVPYLRSLPNLRLLYPKDGQEAQQMVAESLAKLQGPVAIAMPYGPAPEGELAGDTRWERPAFLEAGKDILLLATGPRLADSLQAGQRLRQEGMDVGMAQLRQLHPLDAASLLETIGTCRRVVTIEEGSRSGGVGGAVAEVLFDSAWQGELLRISLPDAFVEAGSQEELAKAYGLDADGIVEQIKRRWAQ